MVCFSDNDPTFEVTNEGQSDWEANGPVKTILTLKKMEPSDKKIYICIQCLYSLVDMTVSRLTGIRAAG